MAEDKDTQMPFGMIDNDDWPGTNRMGGRAEGVK
jgi:hypothetical protein